MKNADITFQDNQFLVTGDLNFSNVMSIYQKSLLQLAKRPEFNFDFSSLQSSDSSGLALMIEWIKLAKQRNKPIVIKHLSPDLLSIAKAAGLDKIIQPHG
jgi:phospholipid transport system transporter-binding protein